MVLINNDIKSVTKLLKLNKECKTSIINYLLNAIELTSDNYNSSPIKSLIISYGIRKGKVNNLLTDPLAEENNTSFHIYYNHKLPIVKNIEEYGNIIEKIEDRIIISLFNRKGELLSIQNVDNQNNVKYFKNGKLMYEWTDHLREDGSIIREIGKTTILWKDGNIIWTKMLKVTRPISKKKTSSYFNNLFITMDIETRSQVVNNNNSILIPYLICWYVRKYKNYKIYMQNFSKFDALFLIKYLVEIDNCKPLIHKDKIISFRFAPLWKKDFGYVTFLDSYLLLPSSLKNLSKSFNIADPKTIFPVNFNDVTYKGNVPDFNLFSGVNIDEYNTYKNNYINKIWDFKEEAIKYCELDCISLHQILTQFNYLIFNKFKLNIVNFPTLPSLAFAIFRSKYLKIFSIYQLTFKIDKDIRQGYTGGSTDMFIPNNPIGTKVYGYDVSSLYASVMRNFPYPVGNPTYFEGNILVEDNRPFGFFFCKITAPDNLKYPILQIHHNNRTVSPLGT